MSSTPQGASLLFGRAVRFRRQSVLQSREQRVEATLAVIAGAQERRGCNVFFLVG